jgi:hypothetical protein
MFLAPALTRLPRSVTCGGLRPRKSLKSQAASLAKAQGLVTKGYRLLVQRLWAFGVEATGLWCKLNLTLTQAQLDFDANSAGPRRGECVDWRKGLRLYRD